jgi:hypothetical protein
MRSHIGKLKIAAANCRDIPMQLLCRELIAGDHLNADVITAAIVLNDQGTPACLFLLIIVSQLPLLILTPSCHCSHLLNVSIALPPFISRRRPSPDDQSSRSHRRPRRLLPSPQAPIKSAQRPSSTSSKTMRALPMYSRCKAT